MRKAFATFGTGHAAELLALSLQTFADYADRHGYELVVGDGDAAGRPPAWGKIPLLAQLLQSYEFVLWVDSDAVIVDPSVDIETVIPTDAFQALVFPAGPCTGVWALRADPRSKSFLTDVWAQNDLVDHKWWEQAAVMRLTGWTTEWPTAKERTTDWDAGTFALGDEWDAIPGFAKAPPRIKHYAGWDHHRRRFAMRTDLAQLRGDRARYMAGVIVRCWWRACGPVVGRWRYYMRQVRSRTR